MIDDVSMMEPVDDVLMANTLRFLAVDAVQKAKSGHPGLPLGMADVVMVLWKYFLKFYPDDPAWPDRDRFVLSAGHGSALLYALLHLFGYGLRLEDLQNFRQYGSRTPGHPEYDLCMGIETTTGPLGQGLGNAVGMALAERWLEKKFNRPNYRLVDHDIYVVVSDGDLMEGVSHEVASLAGHLKLGRLIALYDQNRISIDGSIDLSCSDDVALRFRSYGWQVLHCDGHDHRDIYSSLKKACANKSDPSLIICRTHIGYGSPRQDSAKAHGEPLGDENLQQTKVNLNWPLEPAFYVPPAVQEQTASLVAEQATQYQAWQKRLAAYRVDYPELADAWDKWQMGDLPAGWQKALPGGCQQTPEATRAASGRVLDHLADTLPLLIGGSADLTPSNLTQPKSFTAVHQNDYSGRYIHFGIREHGMGAILNGLALSGLRPYGGTFLVFSDYMRPAVRMAALMGLPVIYIFTHDSIGVGEDGPTHQPVEHLMTLRAIPNLLVFRPADSQETVEAWRVALERKNGPTALILTRQALPQVSQNARGAAQGAYILLDPPNQRQTEIILVASGSEVSLALEACKRLHQDGLAVRLVSMPSWELFNTQTVEYRSKILTAGVPIFAIEAGVTFGWAYYTGRKDAALGIDHFGASGPARILFERFGITPEAIVRMVKESI